MKDYWCELEHYEEVSVDVNGNHRNYGTREFEEGARYYFDLRVSYSESRSFEDHGTDCDTTLEEIEITKVEILRWDIAGHELLQQIHEADVPDDVIKEMKKRVINDFNDGVLSPTNVWEYGNV